MILVSDRKAASRKSRVLGWVDCRPIDPIARYSELLFPFSSDLIDVVLDGPVTVNLHQIFKFGVDNSCDARSLIVTKVQDQSHFSCQLGVQHWSVLTTVGSVLICEQDAVMSVSPIIRLDHVPSTLA